MTAATSAIQTSSNEAPYISVVSPVFNEEENLPVLVARILAALAADADRSEVLLVDDGSSDRTAEVAADIATRHPNVKLVRLSRNFGHQAALTAGLAESRGQVVITLDGDLQHPPEVIPLLLERYRQGADVVQTIRRSPADLQHTKRVTSRLFYSLLSRVAQIRVTPGAADFRLMSRAAVNALLACPERCRFNRGLVQWIGFRCDEIPYDAAPRFAGASKYTWSKMLRLAGDAIFSFSTAPLRLAGCAGVVLALAALAYALFVIWAAMFTNQVVPGWSSILLSVLLIGSVQLLVLWLLGEYIGRLYEEVKQRPLYIIRPPTDQSRHFSTD